MSTVLVLVNNNNVISSVRIPWYYHQGIVQKMVFKWKYYDAICQFCLHSGHKEALYNCKVYTFYNISI